MKHLTVIVVACLLAGVGLPPQLARAEGNVRCARESMKSGVCTFEIRVPGSGSQPGRPGRPGGSGRVPGARPTGVGGEDALPECVGIPCLPPEQQKPPDRCMLYATDGTCASYLPGLPTPTEEATGRGGAPAPAVLARVAVERMDLRAPEIGVWPEPVEEIPDGHTLVGWHNWMWLRNPTPNTWGPVTRTVTESGYAITATAAVTQVTWEMGNGDTKKCGKGTEYPKRSKQGRDEASPTCGYVYHQRGDYTITATAHWVIVWNGLGQQGVIEMDLSSRVGMHVLEMVVVNVPGDGHRRLWSPSPSPNPTGTPSVEAPCPTNHNKHGC